MITNNRIHSARTIDCFGRDVGLHYRSCVGVDSKKHHLAELLMKRSTTDCYSRLIGVLGIICAVVASFVDVGVANALPASSVRRLFVTNNTFIGSSQQIISSNLDGSSPQLIASTLGGSMDVDVFENNIYWTENIAGRIRRAALDGSGVETVFESTSSFPTIISASISIDPIGRRVYWANQQVADMRSVSLDGTDPQILSIAGLDTPYAVAVDHIHEKLYWTEYRFRRLYRANLDGSSPELLVQDGGSLPTVDGLALDLVEGKVYWTNRLLDRVQRANLDGSQVETIVMASGSGSNFRDIEIDPISRKLYWVDDRKDISEMSYIYRANLDGTGSELLMELVGQATGLAISVPEPSAAILLAFSLLGGSGYRRRSA